MPLTPTQTLARILAAGVTAALSLALASCAAGEVPSSGPLAVHERPDYGMDALLGGVLRTDGGCVRVEPSAGSAGTATVVSFPAGDATWNGEVLTWRGEEYRDGDEISLGGGLAPEPPGYVPEDCGDLEVWQVSPL
ncbi:hypothetical protein IF188_06830 [Microbacterium sp. NEAU-LLC]|uniref:Uncharacterized protein n=1 Tax=Microbacterium helvum TaxID=2773713 RepID=A0ABR8NQU8_9MICO|nr:hypothetical protein [Microbacterium helvum]MBD3941411.1 hypothetical protein [Microbacterium helvum]